MIPMVGFCGASNSGKTTLVCGVVSQLSRRGLKVGVIKHHGHPEPLQSSASPKDSDRLAQAGAHRVALVHSGGLWLFAPPNKCQDPAQVADGFLTDMDLVLVEGFKSATIDKIEVVAPDKKPLLPQGGRLLALTRRGGGPPEAGLEVLDADQPRRVADFILDKLPDLRPTHQSVVKLAVNGVELELNPFVGQILKAAIMSMVKPLKGGSDPKQIEVTIID